jgi:hypothetical protein
MSRDMSHLQLNPAMLLRRRKKRFLQLRLGHICILFAEREEP